MNRLYLVAFLLHLTGIPCAVIGLGDGTVLAGQSITVPCHYPPEYTPNVKYWCQGSTMSFCTSLARTDEHDSGPSSKARITIVDDPTQQVFTVTMRDLDENESGWYWCGEEIGGIWSKDDGKSVYISVKEGISVKNSNVSAEEGDSVSIQCQYSKKHRQNEKRWCRSGDPNSCRMTNNRTFISQSLHISDDEKDTVTVTMRRLEMRDAGWYWCSAGEHQAPVHVSVTPRSTITAALDVKTQPNLKEAFADTQGSLLEFSFILQCLVIVCGVVFFLLMAIMGTKRMMEKYKSLQNTDHHYKDIIVV